MAFKKNEEKKEMCGVKSKALKEKSEGKKEEKYEYRPGVFSLGDKRNPSSKR